MDASECAWCSAEIDNGGTPYKGKLFCSVECKEDWDDDNTDVNNIDLDEFEERDVMTDELEEFEGELPADVEDDF